MLLKAHAMKNREVSVKKEAAIGCWVTKQPTHRAQQAARILRVSPLRLKVKQ